MRQKSLSIFVCGTDTGVGKTIVTGAMCAALNQEGWIAGAYKPLESGCERGERRHFKRADSEFLKKMAGMSESLDHINPYFFKEPLAPGVAARRAGRKVSFSKIKKNFDHLAQKYELLFVEGAGGLLVPISGEKTNLDLIQYLGVPVLLVGRLGLGTINHTLLTLDCLKRHGVPVAGVILNRMTPQKNIAEKTNPDTLKKFGVKILGVFPYVTQRSRRNLILASKHLKMPWK